MSFRFLLLIVLYTNTLLSSTIEPSEILWPNFRLFRAEYNLSILNEHKEKLFKEALNANIKGDQKKSCELFYNLANNNHPPSSYMLGNLQYKRGDIEGSLYWYILAFHEYWETNNAHYTSVIKALEKFNHPIIKSFLENYQNLYPLDVNEKNRLKKSFKFYTNFLVDNLQMNKLAVMLERLLIRLDSISNNNFEKIFIKNNKKLTEQNLAHYKNIDFMNLVIGNYYMTGTIGADLNQDARYDRALQYFKKSSINLAKIFYSRILLEKILRNSNYDQIIINDIRSILKKSNDAQVNAELGLTYIVEGLLNKEAKDCYNNAYYNLNLALLKGYSNAQVMINTFLTFINEEENEYLDDISILKVEKDESSNKILQVNENELLENISNINLNDEKQDLKINEPSQLIKSQKIWLKKDKSQKQHLRVQRFLQTLKDQSSHALNIKSLNNPENIDSTFNNNLYNVTFENKSVESDFNHQFKNGTHNKKLEEIMDEILSCPWDTKGVGKPEVLKGTNGYISRRLNLEDRLVYKVSKNNIHILSCKGHYY